MRLKKRMTYDPITALARATAARLSVQYGHGLAANVEAALHARGSQSRPEQYFDPVSLGSLIVSIASLAWTIYTNLKDKTHNLAPEVLARAVRIELRTRINNNMVFHDRVTEIVVTQIIDAADEAP